MPYLVAEYSWAVVPALAFASAWGGAWVTLTGTKSRVQNLESTTTQVLDRLARIETKIDMLMEQK